VVEAVTGDLPLKHGSRAADLVCPPPAVLASFSGQPASRLVAQVGRRERVVAAHFWNPPQLIPLVEVCAGPETAPDVVPWLCDVLRAVGKQPVVLDREIDGFIGNRLQFALLREALALWAAGVASAEAIDLAVKASFGRRLAVTGPLESADAGGLDTMHAFAAFLFPDLDRSTVPPAAMGDLVRAGHRGVPSGRGLYDWSRRDGQALVAERVEELFRHLERGQRARPPAGSTPAGSA
jgi:3-hydroxybutyryl-CoA dehydrogenase